MPAEPHETIARRLLPRYFPVKGKEAEFDRVLLLNKRHFTQAVLKEAAKGQVGWLPDAVRKLEGDYQKALEAHKPSQEAFSAFAGEAKRRLEGDLTEFLASAREGKFDEEMLATLNKPEATALRKKFNAYHSMIGTGKLGELRQKLDAAKKESAQPAEDAAHSLLLAEVIRTIGESYRCVKAPPHGFGTAVERHGFTPYAIAHLAELVAARKGQLRDADFYVAGIQSLVTVHGSPRKLVERYASHELTPGKTLGGLLAGLGVWKRRNAAPGDKPTQVPFKEQVGALRASRYYQDKMDIGHFEREQMDKALAQLKGSQPTPAELSSLAHKLGTLPSVLGHEIFRWKRCGNSPRWLRRLLRDDGIKASIYGFVMGGQRRIYSVYEMAGKIGAEDPVELQRLAEELEQDPHVGRRFSTEYRQLVREAAPAQERAQDEKMTDRVATLEKTMYCRQKIEAGGFSQQKFEEQLGLLTRKERRNLAGVIQAAHACGTLPSILYHEFARRMLDNVDGSTTIVAMQERADEFGTSITALYRRGEGLHSDPLLLWLLEEDEVKAKLYKRAMTSKKHVTFPQLVEELGAPYASLGKRIRELKEDPHLGKRFAAEYRANLVRKAGRVWQTLDGSRKK